MVVLMSFSRDALRGMGNPYPLLFVSGLPQYVEALPFSWKRALIGSYDIFHVHWPDHMLRRRGWRGVTEIALFIMLIARLSIRKTPVVSTLHNKDPHASVSVLRRRLIEQLNSMTSVQIVMNAADIREPSTGKQIHIPHGHYRTAPMKTFHLRAEREGLLYFGPMHPYKGVEDLLLAFTNSRLQTKLTLVGQETKYSPHLQLLAAGDDRLVLRQETLPELDLWALIKTAKLVVLPYRKLHNSGALLLALSLGTTVLVPDNDVTREIDAEVGPGWLERYTGPITSENLALALSRVIPRPSDHPGPLFIGREWPEIGLQTAAVYDQSLSRSEGGGADD